MKEIYLNCRNGRCRLAEGAEKAQKSIDNIAEKLVAVYAKREIVQGFAFPPDTPFQKEFEDAFPYEETEDQLKAIAAIKKSIGKAFPYGLFSVWRRRVWQDRSGDASCFQGRYGW